jgi:hypothetical protein
MRSHCYCCGRFVKKNKMVCEKCKLEMGIFVTKQIGAIFLLFTIVMSYAGIAYAVMSCQ